MEKVRNPAVLTPKQQREMLLEEVGQKLRVARVERGQVEEFIGWSIGKKGPVVARQTAASEINSQFKRLDITNPEAEALVDFVQEDLAGKALNLHGPDLSDVASRLRGGESILDVRASFESRSRQLDAKRIMLMRGSKGKDATQILGEIEAVEGASSEIVQKMKPVIGGEVRFDSHEHVFGDKVDGKHVLSKEHCRRFWENFRKSKTTDMVVLTHNKGLLDSEYVYDTLMANKPKDLEGVKTLWKGIEVKTYDKDGKYTGEIGVISMDPRKRLADLFHEKHGKKTAEEVAGMVKAEPDLVGFLPHPSKNAPDSVVKHMGEERAKELVREYGLLGEYHAAYKDTKDAAKVGREANRDSPGLKRMRAMKELLQETVFEGGGMKGKLAAVIAPVATELVIPLAGGRAVGFIERFYDPSVIEPEAKAMLVGGDYHSIENQGTSHLLVQVPEQKLGKGESLGSVYKPVASDDSGLVLLIPADRLKTRPIVDAILEGNGVAVLPEDPTEASLDDFAERFKKLWGELKAQKNEGKLLDG
ncbi:MAG: hypothetical protein V1875_03920 [Candidatus Altiarchaeota archaeon]